MAHHGHVEVFVEGVHGVWVSRVGRGRQAIAIAGDADDVGRVAATGALGVVHVDGAAADRRQGVLYETGFVQRVGVELDLEIHLVGDGEAGVDGGWHRSPILVDLQAEAAGRELLAQRTRRDGSCRARGSRNSAAMLRPPAASCPR